LIRTDLENAGHSLAHFHALGQCEHVSALRRGDWPLVLAQDICQLLQRQPQLAGINELCNQGHVLGRNAAIKANQQTTQDPADLSYAGRSMLTMMPDTRAL
jgi:hypothetical protein